MAPANLSVMHRRLLLLPALLMLAATLAAQRDTTITADDGRAITLTLPTLPPSLTIGAKAPRLTGTDLDGRPSAAPHRNVVYFFSFVGCKPCTKVLHQLEAGDWRLREGAQLVYVDPFDRADSVAEYLAREYGDAPIEVLLADAATEARVPLLSFPVAVVVDGERRVTRVLGGERGGDFRTLLAEPTP